MTENEQIEEMAESICMEHADGICSANYFTCDHNCEYKIIASQFYSKGYRKVERGEWKKTCVPDVYQCTNCKRPTKMDMFCDSEVLRAFCPNCGADMRGEKG
jgi:hypothetical protein